jgi:hypothetical protein
MVIRGNVCFTARPLLSAHTTKFSDIMAVLRLHICANRELQLLVGNVPTLPLSRLYGADIQMPHK